MATDGTLKFDTKVNTTGFQNGANRISSSVGGMKSAIAGIGTAIAALGAGKFLKESIDLASDLNEVQNVVDVTFQDSSKEINKFAKEAKDAYGLSELQAKRFTGTLGAMIKSMGVSGDSLVDMSENLVGLAGDFASFYNLAPEEAFAKIRSGISGETEPLKQLGVNLSVANLQNFALSQGLEKQYKNMTEVEKATLRYNYLLSVSADAQGDFARTSDSFANQQRIAELNIKDLSTTIGARLLPIVNSILQKVNDFLENYDINEFLDKAEEKIKSLGEILEENLPIVIGITSAIIAYKVAIGIATTAQALYNSVLALNPIGVVIALIIGLAAAFVTAYKKSEKFREFVNKLWETIKEVFQQIFDFVSNIVNSIVIFFTETIPGAFNSLKNKITGFAKDAYKLGKNIVDNLLKGIKNAWKAVKDFFSNAWKGIKDLFTIDKSDIKVKNTKPTSSGLNNEYEVVSRMNNQSGIGASQVSNNTTINFNQKIESPDEVAERIERLNKYGLAG